MKNKIIQIQSASLWPPDHSEVFFMWMQKSPFTPAALEVPRPPLPVMLGLVKTEPQMETRHWHTYTLIEIWAMFTMVAAHVMELQEGFPHECKCIGSTLFFKTEKTCTYLHIHTNIYPYLCGCTCAYSNSVTHSQDRNNETNLEGLKECRFLCVCVFTCTLLYTYTHADKNWTQ